MHGTISCTSSVEYCFKETREATVGLDSDLINRGVMVRLRSGGAIMTVGNICEPDDDPRSVQCFWFSEDGRLEESSFSPDILISAAGSTVAISEAWHPWPLAEKPASETRQFMPGDLARLRSGGPPVAVQDVQDESSRMPVCCWFAAGGLQDALIPKEALLALSCPHIAEECGRIQIGSVVHPRTEGPIMTVVSVVGDLREDGHCLFVCQWFTEDCEAHWVDLPCCMLSSCRFYRSNAPESWKYDEFGRTTVQHNGYPPEGSLLRLKSGGPPMVVASVGMTYEGGRLIADCTWFVNQKLNNGLFVTDTLECVDDPSWRESDDDCDDRDGYDGEISSDGFADLTGDEANAAYWNCE